MQGVVTRSKDPILWPYKVPNNHKLGTVRNQSCLMYKNAGRLISIKSPLPLENNKRTKRRGHCLGPRIKKAWLKKRRESQAAKRVHEEALAMYSSTHDPLQTELS